MGEKQEEGRGKERREGGREERKETRLEMTLEDPSPYALPVAENRSRLSLMINLHFKYM